MKWNENPSDQTPVPDRWGLGEHLASLQTAALKNYTKTSRLILWEMRVFWGVKGKLDFLTSEHPKNCIYVTWVMKRPTGLWEGFYHLRRCLCTEWNSAPDIFPRNVYLRVKFLSIKPTLIYSGELENEMSQLSAIFQFFSCLNLFTTFFF